MSRRRFIALVGSGAVVAAGTGLGLRLTRSAEAAAAPWRMAGAPLYTEPRRRALSFAILAPNPHNMQPWTVDLSTPGEVRLFVDTDRLLPHTDPFNRQITIGLGCFLELMRMAAAEDGWRVETELFPEGSDAMALDARPVAVCRFIEGDATPDPLFAQVPHRRSVKEPYDTERPVPREALDRALADVRQLRAGGTVAGADIAALRALTAEASTIEMNTPRTHKESVDVFRIGAAEVNAQPDGIDITGAMIEALSMTGLFTREASLDKDSPSFAAGRDLVLSQMRTSMGFAWLVSEANTRVDQIAAGRDWLRVHLALTREGIAMQPVSQALQEYPEMLELHKAVHDRLAPDGGTVQMLARLGYHAPVPPSPRWPLEAKLTEG